MRRVPWSDIPVPLHVLLEKIGTCRGWPTGISNSPGGWKQVSTLIYACAPRYRRVDGERSRENR